MKKIKWTWIFWVMVIACVPMVFIDMSKTWYGWLEEDISENQEWVQNFEDSLWSKVEGSAQAINEQHRDTFFIQCYDSLRWGKYKIVKDWLSTFADTNYQEIISEKVIKVVKVEFNMLSDKQETMLDDYEEYVNLSNRYPTIWILDEKKFNIKPIKIETGEKEK